jgi:hypothetical protein
MARSRASRPFVVEADVDTDAEVEVDGDPDAEAADHRLVDMVSEVMKNPLRRT